LGFLIWDFGLKRFEWRVTGLSISDQGLGISDWSDLRYALLVKPIKDSMAVRFEIITTETHGRSPAVVTIRRNSRLHLWLRRGKMARHAENEIIKKLFLVFRRRRFNNSV